MAKPLVSDALWERIHPLLPPRPEPKRPDRPGRPPIQHREALPGILSVLKTATNWAAPTAAGPVRRPRLRFGPASPPLAPARHSTPDRPAEYAARQRVGEISLVCGADAVVAAQLRKAARAQGSNPGYPSGVSQTWLRDNLS